MKQLRALIPVFLTIGLVACGGGGGGSAPSNKEDDSSISGTASKGIVIGGQVKAYLFGADGLPDRALAIAQATTDGNGDYALSIPANHAGKPLFVEITSASGTRMKCDISPFCDENGDGTQQANEPDFGDTFEVAENALSMSAMLAQSGGRVSVNLTPLTTVAASLAQNSIVSGSDNEQIAFAISVANSQVSTTFGLGADITTIPVVDLTTSADVEGAAPDNISNKALSYAALNAAIVRAKQRDSNDEGDPIGLGEAITRFAEEFVGDGGLITNAADSRDTSLVEILQAAVEVMDQVAAEVFNDIDTDAFDQDLAEAGEAEPSTEGYLAPPSNTNPLLPQLAKVKGFVEELREIGTAIDSSIIRDSQDNNLGSVETVLTGFDDQIEAAEVLGSTDVEAMLASLRSALYAIVEIYDAEVDELGVDSVASGDYLTIDGIEVAVDATAERTTFNVVHSFEQLIDGQLIPAQVDVTATLNDISFEEELVAFPGTQFLEDRVPGSYFMNTVGPGDRYLSLLNDGSGTMSGDNIPDYPVLWSVNAGALEVRWQEGEATHLYRYRCNEENCKNIFYGYFTQEIDFNDDGIVDDYANPIGIKENSSTTLSGDVIATLDLALSGSVTSETMELSVNQSEVQIDFDGYWSSEEGVWTGVDVFSVQGPVNLDMAMNVSLSQRASAAADPISFEGSLETHLSEISIYQDKTSYSENLTSVEDLGSFGLSLDGSVGNTSGESFDIRFDLELNGSGVPALITICNCFDWYAGESIDLDLEGESDSQYIAATAFLAFNAELAGVSDVIEVELTTSRTGYDDYSALLDLSYPGRNIIIEAEASDTSIVDEESGQLSITNVNDGIVISVSGNHSGDNPDEEIDLQIRMDTNGDGQVDNRDFLFGWHEERNGLDLLVFADNNNSDNIEFESLF